MFSTQDLNDGSYVINQGLYHVPNQAPYDSLWNDVNAYALAHPEVVMPEPVETEEPIEETNTN